MPRTVLCAALAVVIQVAEPTSARQRGQMENLIKLHKAQLSSDRMSCHSATANQSGTPRTPHRCFLVDAWCAPRSLGRARCPLAGIHEFRKEQ
jgi:hypothetical protein